MDQNPGSDALGRPSSLSLISPQAHTQRPARSCNCPCTCTQITASTQMFRMQNLSNILQLQANKPSYCKSTPRWTMELPIHRLLIDNPANNDNVDGYIQQPFNATESSFLRLRADKISHSPGWSCWYPDRCRVTQGTIILRIIRSNKHSMRFGCNATESRDNMSWDQIL